MPISTAGACMSSWSFTGHLPTRINPRLHMGGGLVRASALATAGLIDEYRFYYVSVLLGSGNAALDGWAVGSEPVCLPALCGRGPLCEVAADAARVKPLSRA